MPASVLHPITQEPIHFNSELPDDPAVLKSLLKQALGKLEASSATETSLRSRLDEARVAFLDLRKKTTANHDSSESHTNIPHPSSLDASVHIREQNDGLRVTIVRQEQDVAESTEDHQANIAVLTETIHSLHKEKEALAQPNSLARASFSNIDSEAATTTNAREHALSLDLQVSQKECRNLRVQVSELQAEVKLLRAHTQGEHAHHEVYLQLQSQLQNQVQNLTRQLSEEQTAHLKSESEKNRRIESLMETQSMYQKEIQRLNSELTTEHKEHVSEASEHANLLIKLKQNVQQLESTKQNLKKQLQQQTIQLREVEATNALLRTESADAKHQKELADAFMSEKETLVRELKELHDRYQLVEKENVQLVSSVAFLTKEIANAQQTEKELVLQCSQLSADLHKSLENNEHQKTQFEEFHKESTKSSERLEIQVKGLEAVLSEKTKQILGMQDLEYEMISQLDGVKSTLEADIVSRRNEKEAMAAVETLRRDIISILHSDDMNAGSRVVSSSERLPSNSHDTFESKSLSNTEDKSTLSILTALSNLNHGGDDQDNLIARMKDAKSRSLRIIHSLTSDPSFNLEREAFKELIQSWKLEKEVLEKICSEYALVVSRMQTEEISLKSKIALLQNQLEKYQLETISIYRTMENREAELSSSRQENASLESSLQSLNDALTFEREKHTNLYNKLQRSLSCSTSGDERKVINDIATPEKTKHFSVSESSPKANQQSSMVQTSNMIDSVIECMSPLVRHNAGPNVTSPVGGLIPLKNLILRASFSISPYHERRASLIRRSSDTEVQRDLLTSSLPTTSSFESTSPESPTSSSDINMCHLEAVKSDSMVDEVPADVLVCKEFCSAIDFSSRGNFEMARRSYLTIIFVHPAHLASLLALWALYNEQPKLIPTSGADERSNILTLIQQSSESEKHRCGSLLAGLARCTQAERLQALYYYLVLGRPDEALEKLMSIAKKGDTASFRWIGEIYRDGLSAKGRQPQQALNYFRAGAKKGDVYSKYQLGLEYRRGVHIHKDLYAAGRLLQAAAEEGLPEAMLLCAELNQSGLGLHKDTNRAKYWTEEAQKRGTVSSS